MTNKEAKEKLYMEWQKFLEDNIDYAGISEAYKTAFKALDHEPCEDTINRQAGLDLIEHYEEEILADNRLIAVSGMSIEELTDAFTKGYRLASPEKKNDQIPDIRVTAEEAAEAIQNLKKAGISQEDIESSDLPLYDPDRKRPKSEDAIEFSEKDAIKMLKSKMDGHTDTSYEWAETVRMAIKALDREPCDTCEVGNPCLYCRHEFEPQESEGKE